MIRAHGAVSAEVAAQMARGAITVFGADVGIGVTGVAGPDSEGDKPAGLTFIGAQNADRRVVREYNWTGDRASNRAASVEAAIELAIEIVS
jgi:PncC family amidohydrolase